MDQPADFRLHRGERGTVLALTGDWTATGLGRTGSRLAGALKSGAPASLDLTGLGRFDTAGAYALARTAGFTQDSPGLGDRKDVGAMMALVEDRMPEDRPAGKRLDPIYSLLIRCGAGVEKAFGDLYSTAAFYGRLMETVGRVTMNPRRIRWAPTVSLMERSGLDALPIVVLTNFFVGATIAFLGANLLRQFGAQIFAVELVGIGVLREFGVLVTAIILAGRSGSAFAAELGAMKMNQEVDAIQVMGVDPYEALVLPRFTAMFAMLPLLTFAAMISGMVGGLLVVWTVLDLSPTFFVQRLLENVGVTHFWVGFVKAPVFAIVIAAIGCHQGLEVGGDVEQLGRRVTTAVVQAIFSIILLDAAFALLFMEMDV